VIATLIRAAVKEERAELEALLAEIEALR